MEDLQDTFIVHTIEEIQVGAAPSPPAPAPQPPVAHPLPGPLPRLPLQREG